MCNQYAKCKRKHDYFWLKKPRKKRPLKERFLDKVKKTKKCWIWEGAINKSGYGNIGHGGKCQKTLSAHRVSWSIYRGDVPSGKCVLHRCDVPKCVNPDHLFIGTQLDNIRDCFRKRRMGVQLHKNLYLSWKRDKYGKFIKHNRLSVGSMGN